MAEYCEIGQLPSVRITAQNNTQTLHFGNSPIDIEETGTDISGQCWKFYSTNNGIIADVFCAFGKNAYYQPDSSLENNGAWLYVDGKNVAGINYYYWSGIYGGTTYGRNIVSVSWDNCGLSPATCTLTISDVQSKNILWTNTYSCSCSQVTYDVACFGCHPNQLQCQCDQYPGYCCIDCDGIKSQLDGLIQIVKKLDNSDGVSR